MKKFTKGLLSIGLVFMFTACHGVKKVEYKEFASAIAEAAKENEAPKTSDIKYSGKYKDEKFSFKASEVNSLKDLDKAAIITLINGVGGAALAYLDGANYYINMGFKVSYKGDDGKFKVEYDKYCRVVSGDYDSGKEKISFSVSYIK